MPKNGDDLVDDQGGLSNFKESQHNVPGELQTIRLKLAQFWPSSPITWFVQAEAQFSISRITLDSSKYYHVLAALPQEVVESILDFVQSPPDKDLYAGIKKLLIDRHSQSEERRIERLLSSEQLGDRKPSDFYRSLKILAGNSGAVGDNLIRNLFLRRLPQTMNIALISLSDKNITELLSIADKIHEATQISNFPSVSTVSNIDSQAQTKIEKEIAELKSIVKRLEINSHQSRNHSRNYSFSPSRNRSNFQNRSRSRNNAKCWYHIRFGSKANKCIAPCNFKTNNVDQTKN